MSSYPNYQKVDSFWYGQIPSTWKKTKNKFLFSQKKSIVGEEWHKFILLTMGKSGVKPRDMDAGGKFPESFETYQKVNPNQIVFCLFDIDETPRTVGLSKDNGMITSAYDVFSTNAGQDPQFWTYFYQMIDDHKGLRPYYTGLRKVVRYDTFMGIEVFAPSLEEQKLISCYLDKKSKHIDALIKKIEKKIELLNEQKTVLINQYTTKGIDPNVEMKDSGIKWIRNIPKHWKLTKIKYFTSFNDEVLDDKTDPNYSFHYIEVGDVSFNKGIFIKEKILFKNCPSRARRIVKPKDVIISTVRTYLKSISIVPDIPNLICSTGFCILRSKNKKLLPEYLSYFVKTNGFIQEVVKNSYGVSYPAINSIELTQFYLLLPPVEEQKQIIQEIGKQEDLIIKIIQKNEEKIVLLKEYLQSLVSSAVTGKIRITEDMI